MLLSAASALFCFGLLVPSTLFCHNWDSVRSWVMLVVQALSVEKDNFSYRAHLFADSLREKVSPLENYKSFFLVEEQNTGCCNCS